MLLRTRIVPHASVILSANVNLVFTTLFGEYLEWIMHVAEISVRALNLKLSEEKHLDVDIQV